MQLAIKAVRDAARNKDSERGCEQRQREGVNKGSQRGCEQRQSERGVRVRNTRKNLAVIL